LKWGNLLLSAISFTIYYVNRYFLIRYLGDAARYFSGDPEHVNMRNEILKDGVDFIKHISESGKYGRIIVVGHSLGSVIAYDLLKYVWADYNTQHNKPEKIDTQALKELEKMINNWPADPSVETVKKFQALQEKLWAQQRLHGNPWLITDLITLGSPLTHAPFLLSNNNQEFTVRKNDRELPTCPPVMENGKIHFYHKSKDFINENGERRSIYNLHHAAGFGPTRWTNLYFKVDLIGGPLQTVFGKGIKDIEVKLSSWLELPVAHTKYWDCRPFRERRSELPLKSSTRQLLESMHLNRRTLLEEVDKAKT
ncbi:MAG: hypothetical protein AAF985_25840, partial [Bacteroidota bacterium]